VYVCVCVCVCVCRDGAVPCSISAFEPIHVVAVNLGNWDIYARIVGVGERKGHFVDPCFVAW
jgi:hypothetical protein